MGSDGNAREHARTTHFFAHVVRPQQLRHHVRPLAPSPRSVCTSCARDNAQPLTFGTPRLRSSKASLRHRMTPPMAPGQGSRRIPVRTRSRHLYAPGCTSPAHHMEVRTVLFATREHARDRSAHPHRVRIFQDKAGTLRYAGSTCDEGHQITHIVAQPLRIRVRIAFTLHERPRRKQFARCTHLIVQGLNTRFTQERRPLRKTFTPSDKKRTENTVLQDRLVPV